MRPDSKTRRLFWIVATTVLVAFASVPPLQGADCNSNGVEDLEDLRRGVSTDCNGNDIPDECEIASEGITFELSHRFITGHVSSMALEDFDGDGDVDIAAAGHYVWILRNDGLGDFSRVERYSVGDDGSFGMIAEDLDLDGDFDLVLVAGRAADVPVFLNRGDGTFEIFTYSVLEGGNSSPEAADFDGDGDLDLAFARFDPDFAIRPGISFFRQEAPGSFAGPAVTFTGGWLGSLLAADLDGDSDVDLAAGVWRGADDEPAALVSVLLNRGDGTFEEETGYAVGERPGRVVGADLDGDGDLDLVSAIRESEDVAVLLNRGDGTFDDVRHFATGNANRSVVASDLDGDGDVDLVTTGQREYGDPGLLSVLLNRGDATFLAPSVLEFEDPPLTPVLADLDGDGSPEIIAPLYLPGDVAAVVERRGGAFEVAGEVPVGGGVARIAPGDLDGDGDIDLVSGALGSGISTILNATGQELTRGCREFLRGDVNADGTVSASDMVALRRYLFSDTLLSCDDAADVNDDERLQFCDVAAYLRALYSPEAENWPIALPEPFPGAGRDATPVGVRHDELACGDPDPDNRLGCSEYRVEPPAETDDLLRVGSVASSPGARVRIPIHLTTSVPVDAVQLVLEHDPEVLTIDGDALRFEGTFFERFPADPIPRPMTAWITTHPRFGVATAIIAGDLVHEGFEVTPGEDILIAWVEAEVSADVPEGSEVTLKLTNGADGQGVGPYRLRNELTHRGEARFASLLPRRLDGVLQIVGDESLFRRGDCNDDGNVNISDAIATLSILFTGKVQVRCGNACDSNDDGSVDLSDAITTLDVLFMGRGTIPFPGPTECGPDPTLGSPGCGVSRQCR